MSASHVYPVIDIDSAWLRGDEPMGSKNKVWVDLPDDVESPGCSSIPARARDW